MRNYLSNTAPANALPLSALFSAMLLLGACSGGGGGGDTAATSTGETTPPVVQPPAAQPPAAQPPAGGDDEQTPEVPVVPEAPVEETAELQASPEFVFSSSYDLSLDVDVTGRISEQTLLVVCKGFDTDGSTVTIDYTDCILRTDLDAGEYTGSLKLTNDTQQLAAALWFYDESKAPEVFTWSRDDSPEAFVVR